MLCRIALACRVMCCAGAQPECFVGEGGGGGGCVWAVKMHSCRGVRGHASPEKF